jgi:hypothetical protein
MDAFYQVEKVSFYFFFVYCFWHENLCFFKWFFCVSWDDERFCFVLFFRYITLVEYWLLNKLDFWDKPHFVLVYNIFLITWFNFLVLMLFMIFALYLEWILICNFLVIFLVLLSEYSGFVTLENIPSLLFNGRVLEGLTLILF